MLQIKKLTKSCGAVVEAHHYELRTISLYLAGRQLVLALFASNLVPRAIFKELLLKNFRLPLIAERCAGDEVDLLVDVLSDEELIRDQLKKQKFLFYLGYPRSPVLLLS